MIDDIGELKSTDCFMETLGGGVAFLRGKGY